MRKYQRQWRLEDIREFNNDTQEDLATLLNINTTTYRRKEKGHSEKESWGKLMSEEDYANKYVPKTKPKQDKKAEPKGLFKVQTGAFAQKENAKALAKKMEKDGYDTHIVKDK